MKKRIEDRIKEIERDIGNEVVDDYHKEIIETIEGLGGDDTSLDGSGRKKLWNLLKRKFPKVQSTFPVGKKDEKGNLITNHIGLKKLYLRTYMNRLRNRPMKEQFEELRELKQVLFDLRLKLCKTRKSKTWELKHLEAAICELKKDKARDPNGWVNELFQEGIAGKNLKLSILKLFNRIKLDNYFPEFMRKADVSTIYKGKGEKSDLTNDRGIFIVSIFRSLLMKLMYLDIYDIIDKSMSDSQIGSRKKKNIRNHIWVVNSIVCDTLSTKKKKPIDIQIYDYKQCFDSLWLEECLNDMYAGGLQDDKLNLLHNANTHVNIAVRTPVGKTERGSIHNVVIQGDVFGPMLCSKQVDLFGKECLDEEKYTYLYKDKVPIPPLSMVDDLVCVSECGYKTAMLNSYMQCKTSSKKLQFVTSKCKKIHVGKQCQEHKCQPLYVDSWGEKARKNTETGSIKIVDEYQGEDVMEEKEEEKYLGDVLSKDGRNLKNIQARVNKGKGIVRKILNILDGIPFGKLYFQIAILLRNSLLVSSLLCNSEAWFNLTNSELDLLETVDVMLLRSILRAPKSTPKEMLFLELGMMPLREMIRERRLNFLHYILLQNADSVIFKVFETQYEERTSKDWVTTILSDLELCKLNVTFADIQKISKQTWKSLVKRSIRDKALKYLENLKQKHSKVKMLEHKRLKMQECFLPNELNVYKEEIQLIFQLRCQVTKLKINLKGLYDTYECEVCMNEDESQKHIYRCPEILRIRNIKFDEIPDNEKNHKWECKRKVRNFKNL